jgi:hypothetical protein
VVRDADSSRVDEMQVIEYYIITSNKQPPTKHDVLLNLKARRQKDQQRKKKHRSLAPHHSLPACLPTWMPALSLSCPLHPLFFLALGVFLGRVCLGQRTCSR